MNKKKFYKPNRPSSNLTKMEKILDNVKVSLKLDDNKSLNQLREIWPLITSFKIAEKSSPAYFDRENNLVIRTKNSIVSTELSMDKNTLLEKLKTATKDSGISFNDLRFVVENPR